jgi:uncharacterized membrane protein
MAAASLAVALVWGAVMLYGFLSTSRSEKKEPRAKTLHDPGEIARRRFALGELSRKELEETLQALEK